MEVLYGTGEGGVICVRVVCVRVVCVWGVEEERMVTQDFMRESKADTCTNDIYPHQTHTHTHTHTLTGENLEVIAKQMQSLESEAIVWQESTPPQLDSTTTIGMESGDSSAAYPSHDGHMTSTPGSDDGHMTSTPGSDDGHLTFPRVGGALTYAISTYYHIVTHYVVCQQSIVRGWG